jgi:hypothetical protein
MIDEYQKRINAHHKAVARAEHELFQLAQLLCPGNWTFHIIASKEYLGMGDHGMRIDDPVYYAVVTNGDDNVTAKGKTVPAAVALLVHYLLNGSVFPLTGNGGRFNLDHWEKKIEEAENAARQGGMAAATKMAYDAAQGATREAIATYIDGLAEHDRKYFPDNPVASWLWEELAETIRKGEYSPKLD